MNAYDKVEKLVYKLRDSLGEKDFLQCKETGANWNNDKHEAFVGELLTLRRLAAKHHRLAEMDCNGEGVIRGRFYRCDGSTPGAYLPDGETTIFTSESDKVEAKIKGICDRIGLRVEFQGDPRGYTCKFYFGDRFLDIHG